MSIDTSTLIVLVLAAVLAGVLLGVLPEWRRLMSGANLPIHRHLRRLGLRPAFDAEVRCALCAGRQECTRRAEPLEDCPNAALFRTGASGTTTAPRG